MSWKEIDMSAYQDHPMELDPELQRYRHGRAQYAIFSTLIEFSSLTNPTPHESIQFALEFAQYTVDLFESKRNHALANGEVLEGDGEENTIRIFKDAIENGLGGNYYLLKEVLKKHSNDWLHEGKVGETDKEKEDRLRFSGAFDSAAESIPDLDLEFTGTILRSWENPKIVLDRPNISIVPDIYKRIYRR